MQRSLLSGALFIPVLQAAADERSKVKFVRDLAPIPGYNLKPGAVLDIPQSHGEAGRDVLGSMTSLSLTDVLK